MTPSFAQPSAGFTTGAAAAVARTIKPGFFVMALAVFAMSQPAAATDLSQARKECAKNPNCAETNKGDGGSTFCVTEKSVCDRVIYCPNTGDCWVVTIKSGNNTLSPAQLPNGGNLSTVPGLMH